MEKIELKPASVFHYFEEICKVPRPSKKEEKIIAYLMKFAEEQGLEAKKDEAGNILMKKPATPGKENLKTVILQSHIDMVCEKNSDSTHDFLNDPIETYIDGEWLKAKGTTLGADNGIGMAAQLAVLAANDIEHGPIECLFTVDEETGLSGAFALKNNWLKSRILLNLDSEDEGEIFIGCAGGIDASITINYATEAVPAGYCAYKLIVGGLKGGHSGMDIILGRGNANKILFRLLRWVAECGIRLESIDGGSLRNAIPREASAVLVFPTEHKDCILKEFDKVAEAVAKELEAVDGDFFMKYEAVDMPKAVMTEADTNRCINLVYAAPNGVMRMSDSMPGLVETSLNMAIVKTDGSKMSIHSLLRSSVDSAKEDLAERLVCLAELAGGKCELAGGYPGWKPNMKSPILTTMQATYNKLYGKEPKIMAIHAGLECGLFGTMYPNWDMISFGPTIMYPHSPDEKVNIASVGKFWDYLVETLKNIPVK